MKRFRKLSKRIESFANGRSFFLLALLMFLLGYLMLSPISPSEELMGLAGGRNVPDTQFLRTADIFYQQLADYGNYGRQLYLTRVSPVDIFIPPAQMLFLSVAITLLLPAFSSPEKNWQLINLLPLPAMIGDYLENWSIIVLISTYPTRLEALATAAMIFTAIKFIFSIANLLLIFVGLILKSIKIIRRPV